MIIMIDNVYIIDNIFCFQTATPSATDLVGQEYCPRVGLGDDTEILIPAGIQKNVQLNVANLLAPLVRIRRDHSTLGSETE